MSKLFISEIESSKRTGTTATLKQKQGRLALK